MSAVFEGYEDRNSAGQIVDYIARTEITPPQKGNKYYMLKIDGGWSDCIRPENWIDGLSALPNCVGYVNGRFNEIGQYGYCKYSFINNPGTDILDAISQGLKIGQEPMLGAVMVWTNSDSSDLSGLSGHVAIVEEVLSPTRVRTSESAYGNRGSWYYSRIRNKGNGNWDRTGYFRCFIYNPAVADYARVTNTIYDYGGAVDYSQSEEMTHNSGKWGQNQEGSIFTTKTVSTEVTRDSVIQVDREYNDISSQSNNLLSYPSLVEAPYIIVKIGDYSFGQYTEKRSAGKLYKTYPNYITSLNVVKINGQVNVYTIRMLYQVQYMDDPNFLDKIFSSVGYGKIKISYGDFASPSFVYKEEEAIITKVTTNVDFSNSKIEYTISCTSSALSAQGTNYQFQRYAKEKPSNVIKQMLLRAKYYHLDNIFPGITGENLNKNFNKFIATDDLAVEIPAQQYMDPISYINYLVTCMVPQEDTVSAATRSATYFMTIHDDSYADYSDVGGTYFKVTKILSTYKTLPTFNTYNVDVGYPGGDHPGENLVMNFQLKDDNSWALLYDYSQSDIQGAQSNYSYSINNQGQAIQTYSPNITLNAIHGKTTPAMKSWWTRMTEFPISATLTIKGLVRAAMLMTYLRVNTYFYGKKHVSSGLYVITRQEDQIDGSGYRTTLSLTRIAGEDEYIERKKYTQINEIVTGVKAPEVRQVIPEQVHVDNGYYQSNGPQGPVVKVRENKKYLAPAGTEIYLCIGSDVQGNEYRGYIYTDVNQFPFAQKENINSDEERYDNNAFSIWPAEKAIDTQEWIHGIESDYPLYLEEDTIVYETDWISSMGWKDVFLSFQVGNNIYFVYFWDEKGKERQRIT